MSELDHHQFMIEQAVRHILLRCYYLGLDKFGSKPKSNGYKKYLPQLGTALDWLGLTEDFVDSYVKVTTEEGADRWLCIGCGHQPFKKMYILTGRFNFDRHSLACSFRGIERVNPALLKDRKMLSHTGYPDVAEKSKYLRLFEACRTLKHGFVLDSVPDWSLFIDHCANSGVEAAGDIEGWNALRAAFVVAQACFSEVKDYDKFARDIRDQERKKKRQGQESGQGQKPVRQGQKSGRQEQKSGEESDNSFELQNTGKKLKKEEKQKKQNKGK
jgi:hypothetical protein